VSRAARPLAVGAIPDAGGSTAERRTPGHGRHGGNGGGDAAHHRADRSHARHAIAPRAAAPEVLKGSTGLGRRGARHRRGGPRLIPVLIAAPVIGVLIAVSGLFSLVGDDSADSVPPRSVQRAALESLRSWIQANLDPDTPMLAPAPLSDALIRDGYRSDRLVHYSATGSVDWRCCRILLRQRPTADSGTTPAWTAVLAQTRPIAEFAVGADIVEVREIFAGRPAEQAALARSDRAAREEAGQALAENPRLDLAPRARAALVAGEVDSRLLVALVGISGRHVLNIEDFPRHPAEQATLAPRRSVQVTVVDGHQVAPDERSTRKVLEFLAAQVAPFRPDTTSVTKGGGGGTLTIAYRAPTPVGLLAPGP
jgi:hypothetical protein